MKSSHSFLYFFLSLISLRGMLEYVYLVISSILCGFVARAVIFLHAAWKHHTESSQITHQSPATSTLGLTNDSRQGGVVLVNDSIAANASFVSPLLKESTELSDSNLVKIKSGNKDNYSGLNSTSHSKYSPKIVVSILIATNNEEEVIDAQMKSLEMLSYERDRFEIIVVDDSTDSTPKKLDDSMRRIKNLRIIRRSERLGSKGAALNLALQSLRKDSSWVIIIDADTVLPPDIIQQFLFHLDKCKRDTVAIQGYSIPYNNSLDTNLQCANWVSKGIEFRLAQRNLVELVAKNRLHLPVQITGNLFIIKASILKALGFSTDICEDWNLTLSLFFKAYESKSETLNILFHENINASNQAPTSLTSYFKQRLRVSEGHTREFVRMIPDIILQKQPLKNKIEFIFTGCRYLLYILVPFFLLQDLILLSLRGSIVWDISILMSLSIQCLSLIILILANGFGIILCRRSKQYSLAFLTSKLLLEFCTIPALIGGSLLGIVRKKGNFHRTLRISKAKTGRFVGL